MATINLGAIKFNWKGAYNSSTSYAVDDVVSSGGNSYVCIQAHSNQAVGNATAYWNIMSSAGTNGTDGTDLTSTLTAQGDIVYRDGSGLAKLGAGTSGQFLKTQGTGANPVWGTVAGGLLNIYQYFINEPYVVNTGTGGTAVITSSSIAPVSSSSVFYTVLQITAGTGNDGTSSFMQFSADNGSNYSNGTLNSGWGSTNNFHGGSFIMGDQDNAQTSMVFDYFAPNTANNIKIRGLVAGHNGTQVYVNRNPNNAYDTSKASHVSSMTIYEVASGVGNGNSDVG